MKTQETQMKRDMDLVREILIAIECSEDGNLNFDALEYERQQVYLHIELMKEHGLVDAVIIPDDDGPEHEILMCKIERLTWDGHDFLDKIRNESIWEQAKSKCFNETGGLSIDFLKIFLIDVAKNKIGIE